jgi:hypothetical protein
MDRPSGDSGAAHSSLARRFDDGKKACRTHQRAYLVNFVARGASSFAGPHDASASLASTAYWQHGR